MGSGCFRPQDISERLGIGYQTVKRHLHNTYHSLGIPSILQLGIVMYWKALQEDPEPGPPPKEKLSDVLSGDDLRLANLIADGHSNSYIGRVLNASTDRAKDRAGRVFKKMGFTSRVELAFLVLRDRFFFPQSVSPTPQ